MRSFLLRMMTAIMLMAIPLVQIPAQQPGAKDHVARGSQLMHDQLFEAAARELKRAVAIQPTDPRAHLQYAVCLLSLGRNADARIQLEHVRKLAGESRIVTYYLGRLDLLSSDYASAISRLASVMQNPPFPDAAFYLGVAYLSSGDSGNGIKWLEHAVKLSPNDYRVHYRLARAYSTAGREHDASREYAVYEHLLSEHKSTEADVRACSESLHSQNFTSAHDVCQRMFDPNDPEKLTLLGQLYGDAGDLEHALNPLQCAVQLDAGSYEAWQDLGLTYFRLKRYQEARAPLEKAVSLRPEAYNSVVMLGATLYMLGDDTAAIPVLEQALRLKPDDSQTRTILEKLRSEKGKS